MVNFLQRYWLRKQNIRNLFYIDSDKNLCANILALTKLQHLTELYDGLCSSFGSDYISQLVKDWLGNRLCNDPQRLQEHLYGALDEFIHDNLNKPIQEQDMNAFYERYILIYNSWCDKILSVAPEKVDAWHKVRKGKDRKKSIICQSLEIAEKPYTVVKKNNCWILTHKENVTSN